MLGDGNANGDTGVKEERTAEANQRE